MKDPGWKTCQYSFQRCVSQLSYLPPIWSFKFFSLLLNSTAEMLHSVAAPEIICWGASRGQNAILSGKIQKFAENGRFLPFFPSDWGASGGAEPLTGEANALHSSPWCSHWLHFDVMDKCVTASFPIQWLSLQILVISELVRLPNLCSYIKASAVLIR